MMLEELKPDPDQGKALTLPNLLLLWGFFAPPTALGGYIKAAGGDVLRYCAGIPIALLMGAIVVYLNWNFWRYLLVRSESVSAKLQNVIFLTIFALHLMWIGAGYFIGFQLGRIVVRYVP